VAWGVNQVEVVNLAIIGFVLKLSRLRLDGDATLSFNVHGVEHLGFHLPILQPAATLYQSIGQRRFAMIDVRNDGEISDVIHQGPATSV